MTGSGDQTDDEAFTALGELAEDTHELFIGVLDHLSLDDSALVVDEAYAVQG